MARGRFRLVYCPRDQVECTPSRTFGQHPVDDLKLGQVHRYSPWGGIGRLGGQVNGAVKFGAAHNGDLNRGPDNVAVFVHNGRFITVSKYHTLIFVSPGQRMPVFKLRA